MPPKRKNPKAAPSTTTKPPPAKRRSKLAKENNITPDQESEILEAFSLFSSNTSPPSSEPHIATTDVRRCLIALNAPPCNPTDLADLLEAADPDDEGWVSYERFVAIAALQVNRRGGDPEALDEEVGKAFYLFTKGEERVIGLADLKRIAGELREDVPESVLRDMLREATGGGLGGVGLEDFEGVMRRAGVFGR